MMLERLKTTQTSYLASTTSDFQLESKVMEAARKLLEAEEQQARCFWDCLHRHCRSLSADFFTFHLPLCRFTLTKTHGWSSSLMDILFLFPHSLQSFMFLFSYDHHSFRESGLCTGRVLDEGAHGVGSKAVALGILTAR